MWICGFIGNICMTTVAGAKRWLLTPLTVPVTLPPATHLICLISLCALNSLPLKVLSP